MVSTVPVLVLGLDLMILKALFSLHSSVTPPRFAAEYTRGTKMVMAPELSP